MELDSEFLIATDENGTHEHALAAAERRLWLEVLKLAISDIALLGRINFNGSDPTKDRARLRSRALKWIQSDDEIDTGSFHWICSLFDLNAAAVRKRLLGMSPEELKAVLRHNPSDNHSRTRRLQNPGSSSRNASTTGDNGAYKNEVAKLRRRLGLTQEQLAYRIKVSKSMVCRWELGYKKPSEKELKVLQELAIPNNGANGKRNGGHASTGMVDEPTADPIDNDRYQSANRDVGSNGATAQKTEQKSSPRLVPKNNTPHIDTTNDSTNMAEFPTKEERTMSKDDHMKWLRAQLGEYEDKLAQAEAEAQRLKPLVDNMRVTVEALAASNGNPTTATDRGKVVDRSSPAKKPAVNGKLKRHPDYQELSMFDAIKQILDGSTEPIHHDQLTRSIFDVSEAEFERAKSSVTARLSQGAKLGHWQALGAGRFAANRAVEADGKA